SRLEQIIGERLRFIQLQPVGGQGFAERAERERRSGDAFQNRAAIWSLGHVDPSTLRVSTQVNPTIATNHNDFRSGSLKRWKPCTLLSKKCQICRWATGGAGLGLVTRRRPS